MYFGVPNENFETTISTKEGKVLYSYSLKPKISYLCYTICIFNNYFWNIMLAADKNCFAFRKSCILRIVKWCLPELEHWWLYRSSHPFLSLATAEFWWRLSSSLSTVFQDLLNLEDTLGLLEPLMSYFDTLEA